MFKTLQILFGLDFGFLNNKSKKCQTIIIKIGSFIQCAIFSSLCYLFHEKSILNKVVGGIIYLYAEYVIACLIFILFRNGTTFYDFNINIQNIDYKMCVKTSSYRCELKLMMTTLILVVARIVAVVAFCLTGSLYCLKPYWINPIFLIEQEAFNLLLVVTTMLYYGINCRLLKLLVVAKDSEDYIGLQSLYKAIANISEKYKTAFDPAVSELFKKKRVVIFFFWHYKVKNTIQYQYSVIYDI